MTEEIGFDDVVLDYASIAQARQASGLRLVLGAYTIPGPWREACKCLFEVKRIPYLPVRTADDGAADAELGNNNTQSELIAWTAQASAPVAVWNQERPRSAWIDQLNLAERLAPDPALVPADIDLRMQMFGCINEIAGQNGLGWCKRNHLIHKAFEDTAPGSSDHEFWTVLARKYAYTPDAGRQAVARMVEILTMLGRRLERQHRRGSRYLIGDSFSALDIYWSTFYAIFEPLPHHLCPMATSYRPAYTNSDPDVAAAIAPELAAHRDFIYESHLTLPIVF